MIPLSGFSENWRVLSGFSLSGFNKLESFSPNVQVFGRPRSVHRSLEYDAGIETQVSALIPFPQKIKITETVKHRKMSVHNAKGMVN